MVSVSKSWVEQRPHLNPPLSVQFVGLGFCSGQHAETVCLPLKVKLYHCSVSPWSVAGSAWHISSSHPPSRQLLHIPIGPMLSICPIKTGYCYFLPPWTTVCAWSTHWAEPLQLTGHPPAPPFTKGPPCSKGWVETKAASFQHHLTPITTNPVIQVT